MKLSLNTLNYFENNLCVGIVSVLGDWVFIGILREEWYLGYVMCHIWHYSSCVVLIVSNNLLIGMSVDRYLALRYPPRAITGEYRPYKAIVICSWILAILIPVRTLAYLGAVLDDTTYYYHITLTDIRGKLYVTCTLLLVFVIPFLAVSVCYVGITVVVWNHWRESINLTEITAFFICWLPAPLYLILDVFNISVLDSRYYMVLELSYPLNSA